MKNLIITLLALIVGFQYLVIKSISTYKDVAETFSGLTEMLEKENAEDESQTSGTTMEDFINSYKK